jgi:hypothetical protein
MASFMSCLIISPTTWPIEPGPPLPKLSAPSAAALGRSFRLPGPVFGLAMMATGATPSIAMWVNCLTGS